MPEHRTAFESDTLYGRVERLALAAGALIMLGIVAASVIIAVRTDFDVTQAGIRQIDRARTMDLRQGVTAAETGQRGYLLTGKDAYLTPYDDAVVQVQALLEDLTKRLPDSADMAHWRDVVQDKMANWLTRYASRKSGRKDEALALVQTDRGHRDMVESVRTADVLATRQQEDITRHLHRSQTGARLLVAVDFGAFVLLTLLVVAVGKRLNASVARLRASEEALQSANAELKAGSERLEEAVRERTFDLTNANDEIQRFAYIVSHDLRAPLLNIIGFTGELEVATSLLNRFVSENLEPAGIDVPADVREASQSDLPEAIRFIQTSTSKMDRLITAILRLSREGRRVLAPERLDMRALLDGIIDSVHHQADEAGATLTLGAAPTIVSDRIAVEQVFSNLVENALKYRAAGRPGRIEIDGKREGALIRFEVRDNGRGIAQRDLERVFELFRRAGPQDTSGEGIGLAHVRALVRRLGGTIECESTLDAGSSFIVRLPPKVGHSEGAKG